MLQAHPEPFCHCEDGMQWNPRNTNIQAGRNLWDCLTLTSFHDADYRITPLVYLEDKVVEGKKKKVLFCREKKAQVEGEKKLTNLWFNFLGLSFESFYSLAFTHWLFEGFYSHKPIYV